ncbi:MAG: EAL domain-containing protein [Bauldia sp.]|nr:EAL domain-containing protein [Bauldia sp.]
MAIFSRRHVASAYRDYGGAIIDGAVIAVALLIIYLLIHDSQWFEGLYDYTRDHEDWQLDEVIVIVLLSTAGLLIFGTRRLFDQRREIRDRQRAEDAARNMALADALTGLPNRRRFEAALTEYLAHPGRGTTPTAVMMIDLDRFKPVNDVFGHATGDEVLIAFAKRATNLLRDDGMLARFGGDEFAFVLTATTDDNAPSRVARRLLGIFDEPFAVAGTQVALGASIGIALAPDGRTTSTELLRRADIALYRAKYDGRGRFYFFEPDMDAEVHRRARLERDLRQAVTDGTVEVHYQPIVDLRTRTVKAFEALARWTHPEYGAIEPVDFLGIAEDGGFIIQLSDHLFRTACRDAASWPPSITLSFNLARADLADRRLVTRTLTILNQAGLAPDRLEVEISENALVKEIEAAKPILAELHRAGIRIALDDFGTGNSSLYHIREELFDRIKIDRSFVAAMRTSRGDAAVVRAIVGLSKALGLPVTAEGIEDPTLVDTLIAEGCDDGQGFSFGAAVAAAEAAVMVANS